MKKRVVGAVVLVIIGILIPLLLVRWLHGGGADSESMRVYEITPEGQAQRTDSGGESGQTGGQAASEKTQTPAQVNVDGATGVPRRDDRAEAEPARPEAVSPKAGSQSMHTPPVAGQQSKQTSSAPAPATPEPQSSAAQAKEKARAKPQAAGATSAETPAQSLRKSTSSEGWVVQVASFGDEDNAQRLARALNGDFQAFYRAGDVDGKTYYRVRVGPFDTEDAARSAAAKLRQRGRSTLIHRAE